MAKTPKEYQRLPGRGLRLEGSQLFAVSRTVCSLWMGGDHLLLVDRSGYSETYKRFYFRDIQAVIIRKTVKGAVASWVLGLLALLFIFWALAVVNLPGRVTLWIIGGLFAFFTLVSLWLGPTCVTQFKTPVQIEQVPSWNRLRAARKGLDRIRPRILEAQGAYVPEELKAELEERLRRQSQAPPGETS